MQMNRCDPEKSRRKYLVGWLYLVALGHVLVAIAMTIWGGTALLGDYHQQVLASFGLPLHYFPEEDEEYVYLSRDAALIDLMINRFEEEYKTKLN